MIEAAVDWIKRNTLPDSGVVVHSRQRTSYPEVTGYYIPTLMNVGERALAQQYASWLCAVQLPDGSFGAPEGSFGFAFDTGQVIRGWISVLPLMSAIEAPLRRACDWLLTTSDPTTCRLRVPPPGDAWSLGARGEVNEGIHLYALGPLRQAGVLLGERRYLDFVDKSLSYYLTSTDLTSFERPNSLSHFFAYIQEALVELGCEEIARRGMSSVARYQRRNGAVPGYSDVPWICSTGLAQLAKVWYSLGDKDRADRALEFMSQLQNSSGGFFGSYGVQANYFPSQEISWAVKYFIDAAQMKIARHFDGTVDEYRGEISVADGRVQSIIRHVKDLNGKKVLDAGCGKGRYSALIKRLFPRADITAMDISPEMLKHVPSGIRTIQNGILNMPFEDSSFDLVLCIEALEHVVQTDAAIGELSRVVGPEGWLVVIDKNKEKLGTLQMPPWEKWFGRDELLKTMTSCGLDATAEEISYDNHTVPDGLFISWVGHKVRAAGCTVLDAPGTFDNFFREMPLDELNARLMDAARQERYGVLVAHLFEQDKHLLKNSTQFHADEVVGKRHGMQEIYRFFDEKAAKLLDEGKTKICELGVGGGFLAFKLADLGFDVTALDASAPRVLALQNGHHPEKQSGRLPRFVFGLYEHLPFQDNEFDFIISQETLGSVFDLGKTLSETARVLKSSGIYLHQVPNGRFADRSDHLRLFSKEALEHIFSTPPLRLDTLSLIPYPVGDQPANWFCIGRKVTA